MNNAYNWYSQLLKPSWAPPSWLFGPVWTVLYILIAISFGMVFYKAITRKLKWKIALPFILNLIFNGIFTYLQFGLRSNLLAAVDIVLVLTTLVWAFMAVWPKMRWVVYVNIPYFLWVCFATILQLTVTYLNR